MPFTSAALNAMGDHIASLATRISLHSANPGTTGVNETTAARQVADWSASAGGVLSLSAGDSFTGGAASGAVTYVGLWNTAGTVFYGGFQITVGDTSFNAAGEYTLNDITITGA